MSARAAAPRSGTPSLALGYLAALPLFLAYELAVHLQRGLAVRATAERTATLLLAPLGRHAELARLACLGAAAGLAWAARRRAGEGGARELLARAARLGAEGALAGLVLGPLLVALQAWLGSGPLALAPERARGLVPTLGLIGAAPWEELLFRVGLYGGVFLAVHRSCAFLGLETRLARAGAELAALLASALLFALFHLAAVQQLLGAPGEPFHRGLFLWRVSAGLLLGGLFRWRGFGVASWAHAVFNLGIALGIRA